MHGSTPKVGVFEAAHNTKIGRTTSVTNASPNDEYPSAVGAEQATSRPRVEHKSVHARTMRDALASQNTQLSQRAQCILAQVSQ